MKPKILLLDEPLSALDGVIKESIKSKIKEIAREFSLTTIIVTHDPEEALTLSDKVLIINDGEIAQYGTPKEIIQQPADDFVENFILNQFFKQIFCTVRARSRELHRFFFMCSKNQLSQQILSTVVTKEPVTEKVTVGTKKVSSGASYITGRGQFIWPVPGYRNCSRWYGGSHKGVDICAAAGTPIYASAGGTVTKAGYNRAGAGNGYGNSIIISHGNGYTTLYAHCLSLVVHAGQSVKQGQLIGYVGSTGRSSGNHCHFEIRRNGSYIAPQNVFNRSKYR